MTDIVSILRLVVLTLVIVNAVRSWRSGKNDDRRYQGRGVRSIIIWLFAGPLWLITLFALLQGDVLPIVVALHAAATILLFPWPIISRVLIPAGMTRTAYHLARLADFTWAQDRHGGMLTAAALAARIDPKRLPWLRAHLESADLLGAGGVFATALVADIDGDHARADAIASSLDHFDKDVVPTMVRRLRAERSAWRLLSDADKSPRARRDALLALDGAGSASIRFLQACARRDDAPTTAAQAKVYAAWLLAPRRRHTWARARTITVVRDDAPPPAREVSDFGSAALRHAELKASRALTIDDVAALADAWQRATTQAQQTTYERARALGINGDDAAASLERTVGAALAVLVARLDLSRTNIATLPTSMQLAVAELRSQHLDALELMVSTWRDRLADPDKRGRPVVDELREWCALRELCSAVEKTGDDGAYLAFEAGQWVICELAVQLWNERKEYRVANAMFRSLLSQARALGDTRAIETQEKNVACGC